MSGVKGMRHYGAQIIESVLNLREEGKSHREIAEIFGLKSSDQSRELCRRYKRRMLQMEQAPNVTSARKRRVGLELSGKQKEEKIRMLELQVELLRNFVKEIGRGR